MSALTRFGIFFIFLLSTVVSAETLKPAREAKKLTRPVSETVVRVSSAQVVAFNRPLLEQDFPFLRGRSDSELRDFLLNYAGYMAIPQTQQTLTNTEIATNFADKTTAFRPDYYRRALVFIAGKFGLLDVKGAGSLNPETHDIDHSHRNGLFSLGEAIREYVWQRKIQEILDHSGSGINTVGNYGLISWGFNIKEGGHEIPAGAIIRQAKRRHKPATSLRRSLETRNHFLSRNDTLIVERTLRAYGISSIHKSDKFRGDALDIQGTSDNDLVDFGTFHLEKEFSKDAYFYPERKVSWSRPLLPLADSPQPVPGLALPWNIWGASETGRADPKYDNAYVWSHRLAKDFSEGRAELDDIQRHIEFMLNYGHPDPSKKNWSVKQLPCKGALNFF